MCQLRSAFETAAQRALNTSGGQKTQLLKNSGSEQKKKKGWLKSLDIRGFETNLEYLMSQK